MCRTAPLRVKSNALYGLALGEEQDGSYGWAPFSGKSTHIEPRWSEPEGNYEFIVYLEDRNEPATGVYRLWLEVKDKDSEVVSVMSMPREAVDNAVDLQGGNIVVPLGTLGVYWRAGYPKTQSRLVESVNGDDITCAKG